jgi:hypothetical protein
LNLGGKVLCHRFFGDEFQEISIRRGEAMGNLRDFLKGLLVISLTLWIVVLIAGDTLVSGHKPEFNN